MGSSEEIVSTTRGILAQSAYAARMPNLNDAGEEVYYGLSPSNQGPWTIYSTASGVIANGTTSPAINNNGEIVWGQGQTSPETLYSNQRGIIMQIPPSTISDFISIDITDSGEVVCSYRDIDWSYKIYSSVRGRLLELKHTISPGIAINNHGDIIYINRNDGNRDCGIYSVSGTN